MNSIVRAPYAKIADKSRCGYVDYEIQDRDDVVFHPHFLNGVTDKAGLEEVLDEQMITVGGENVARTFWLNQDVKVPVDSFVEMMERAVEDLQRRRDGR